MGQPVYSGTVNMKSLKRETLVSLFPISLEKNQTRCFIWESMWCHQASDRRIETGGGGVRY